MGGEKTLMKTNPENIQQIYQILSDTIRIFNDNDLKYWTIGGTTLGAVRHKGMFEWDDDADLGIWKTDIKKFLSLRSDFKKCGYSIAKVWFGYKIFLTKIKPEPGLNYSYPFLDIFPFLKKGSKAMYASKDARETWSKETLLVSEIENAKPMKFGDLYVDVPYPPEQVLNRHFGSNWNEIAYREYDHTKEEVLTPFVVKLTKKDRLPALPGKPLENKKCLGYSNLHEKSVAKKFPIIRNANIDCSKDKLCETNDMPIYVINCEFSEKRLASFSQDAQREGLNFCREPCVDGRGFTSDFLRKMIRGGVVNSNTDMTPIELAIFLSHYNCWVRIVESCQPYGIVMEDDLRLKKNFVPKLDSYIHKLRLKVNFDILFLWDGDWQETRKTSVGVKDVFQHQDGYNAGGVAYVLSSKLAKILINNAFPIADPVDIYIGDYFDNGIVALGLETNKVGKWRNSPLIKVEMGGLEGTGDTTQDYDMTPIFKKK